MGSDEQEIRQLVATWIAATKAGDVETVLNLMAEDVVFLVPGQAPMRRTPNPALIPTVFGRIWTLARAGGPPKPVG